MRRSSRTSYDHPVWLSLHDQEWLRFLDRYQFLLPIDEPIPVESSYMLGGGEYLDLDQAEAW
jgi:hypothetical protein